MLRRVDVPARWCCLSGWLLALLVSGGAAAQAAEVIYEVREPLGYKSGKWSTWYRYYCRRELLSYAFTATEGACHRGSAQLAGAGGELPVQLADVETWGDSPFVKRATVYFLVDRPEPLSRRTYTLTYGPAPREAGNERADLFVKVVEDGGRAIFASSLWSCQVYLNIGDETYDEPVPAADVPGPFAGMKFGDAMKEPEGGSRLTGDGRVKSWSGRVTERGPVVARAAFEYVFADGNRLTMTARMVAGDGYTRWEMNSAEDRPGQGLEMRMMRWANVAEAGLPKGYGQWARDRTVAVKDSDEPFAYLGPDTSLANIFPDCPPRIRLVRKLGEDRADINFVSHDPAAWVDPAAPLTYGGFRTFDLEMIPKMWERWKRKRIAVSYEQETPVLRMSLARGQRKWSVGQGGPRAGDGLDRLDDMILDWPAADEPRPWLFVDRERVESLWKEIGDDPATLRARGLLTDDAISMTTMRNRRAWMASAAWNVHMMMSDHQPTAHAARRGLANAATQNKMEDMALFNLDGSPPRTPREKFYQRMYHEHAIKAPVMHMEDYLVKLGHFDVMRHAITVAAIYDAVIDSDLVTPDQRRAHRAQMAYLAYLVADPRCWDMERGYITGNPNMSVSYTMSLGVIACALRDHPMAVTWADRATRWMDKWLTDEVGPNGTWVPEGAHYGIVSLEPMLAYAAAAKRAGFHDFSDDPRLKRLMLYWAHHQAPPHPQHGNRRVSGSYGRGTAAERKSIFGVAARLFSENDPDFASVMQWMWAQTGYPVDASDFRMGGYEGYYMDRKLPARAPDWGSRNFPALGAVLRHGFNTPNESYLNVLSNVRSLENLDVWAPGVGGIAQWFARGKPVSTCFTFKYGYSERHSLLCDGVRLTHSWTQNAEKPGPFGYYTDTRSEAFASLASVDYVRSTFTVTDPDTRDWFPPDLPSWPSEPPAQDATLDWTRQMLFLRDVEPAGTAYLVLRDSVQGGQPTAWQFWTLSEKLGAAADAADVDSFLADKPGRSSVPARRLPGGERYTALGQFGVDLEFFVSAPKATPRHTLRYGGVLVRRPEHQDLLHLQLPGDGAYYVAMCPRKREESAPAFRSLARGRMIKVAGDLGTDYSLLAPESTTARAEGVTLSGTAAAVQARATGTTLSIGAAGEALWKKYGLASDTAAALHVAPDGRLTLSMPARDTGGVVTVHAPRGYALEGARPAVALNKVKRGYEVTFPAGTRKVVLKQD